MSRSVLVVDDEPGIAESASAYLRRDGFGVRTATTGRRALDSVATQAPDLVVLDLMLPDLTGEEVVASLRRHTAVPILMLTAKAAESDRLRGLALGADDHLVKPFSPRELVARVRAILRRVPGSGDPPMDLLVVDGGRLEVDLAAHEARLAGRAMALTATEFRLLATLARQPRRVFSRFGLLQALQGPDVDGFARTVDVHVVRLRKKMDETLEVDAPPARAVGDRDAVLQIITNLLSNALKYAPETSVVDLSTATEDGLALVRVRDAGSGLRDADAARVFDRFYLGAGTSETSGGAGLGLTIARELAVAQGGSLRIDDAGPRTCFVLMLPAATAPPDPGPSAADRDRDPARPAGRSL